MAARTGGRWNPPNSFGALYLDASIDVARATVDRLYVGMPYGTEDLEDGAAPLLLDGVDGFIQVLGAVAAGRGEHVGQSRARVHAAQSRASPVELALHEGEELALFEQRFEHDRVPGRPVRSSTMSPLDRRVTKCSV